MGKPNAQWLLLFRVALSVVLLAGGAVIHFRGQGPPRTPSVLLFYGALAGAFVLSLAIAAVLRSRAEVSAGLMGDLQLLTDVVVTTLLVYATGGQDSVLTFLYPLNTLYAAALVSAPAGYATAITGATLFTGMVALQVTGVLGRVDDPGAPMDREAVSVITATAGANFLVAMLAGQLSEQLRRSGETLSRTRQEMGDLRELHSAIVSSMANGVVTTDDRGRVVLVNPAAEAILGAGEARLLGQTLPAVLPQVAELLSGADAAEVAYHHPDGTTRQLTVATSTLQRPDGHLRGGVYILTDVTEDRRMADLVALSRRLATIGQFAAGLAHELRNPLGSMIGCVELLRQGALDNEDARLLGIIHREAERLARLVQQFLSFARPQPPQLRRTPLAALLTELAEMANQDSGLAITVAVDADPALAVRADPEQIRQALWNLLRNAAQASPPGSTVALKAEKAPLGPGPGVRITVTDSGPGVTAEAASRLFEPFFTTKAQGTGLGLAIVHRIVEQHGGQVGLLNTASPGAVFYLTLQEHDGSMPPAPRPEDTVDPYAA